MAFHCHLILYTLKRLISRSEILEMPKRFQLVKVATGEKKTFQFVEYTIFSDLRSGADKIKLLVIYRPPYSTAHRVTVATFLDEFALIILSPELQVITGDMNIHVDDPNDPDAIKFLDLLDTYGLTHTYSSYSALCNAHLKTVWLTPAR